MPKTPTEEILCYFWGTRNLAATHLDGHELAKQMSDLVQAEGLKQPGPHGGGYGFTRDASGKLALKCRVGASGKNLPLHSQKPTPWSKNDG